MSICIQQLSLTNIAFLSCIFIYIYIFIIILFYIKPLFIKWFRLFIHHNKYIVSATKIFSVYLLLIQPLIPKDPLRVLEFNFVYCILGFRCPLKITVDKPL